MTLGQMGVNVGLGFKVLWSTLALIGDFIMISLIGFLLGTL